MTEEEAWGLAEKNPDHMFWFEKRKPNPDWVWWKWWEPRFFDHGGWVCAHNETMERGEAAAHEGLGQ